MQCAFRVILRSAARFDSSKTRQPKGRRTIWCGFFFEGKSSALLTLSVVYLMTKLFSPYLNWISEFYARPIWFNPRFNATRAKLLVCELRNFVGAEFLSLRLEERSRGCVCTLARIGGRPVTSPKSSKIGIKPIRRYRFCSHCARLLSSILLSWRAERNVRRKLNSRFLIDSYVSSYFFHPFSRSTILSTIRHHYARVCPSNG